MSTKFTFLFLIIALLCILNFSCNTETDNSLYFKALVSIQNDDIPNATNLLKEGISKSNDYFSSLCIIKLSEFVPKTNILNLAKKYDFNKLDDETIQQNVLKLYYDAGEYKAIIAKTSPNFNNNAIEKLRLLSLYKTANKLCAQEESEWFSTVPFSSYHSSYLKERYEKPPFLLDARNSLFKQNYQGAFLKIQKGFEVLTHEEKIAYLTSRTEIELSDIGKILLYSDSNKIEYGELFETCASIAQNDNLHFYFLFYSARLFERESKIHYLKAQSLYKAAMVAATTPEKYDNALWYYLRCSNNISSTKSSDLFIQYANTWNDPTYFDDLMSTCISNYLTAYKWQDFCAFFNSIRPYLSNTTKGKVNYILGRLLENNLVKADNLNAKELYLETFNNSEADFYYRVLAAERLNLDSNDFANFGNFNDSSTENEPEIQLNNYEIHLSMLVEYGFYDEIYDFYTAHANEISKKVIFNCIETLSKQGENYYYDCIKMATKALSVWNNDFSVKNLQKTHPQFFAELVSNYAQKYNLPEYLIYGLIRTESYFNPKITSSAGAVGLCQLMPATANDISKKLKMPDYDLTDANTSLNFGLYYLQELIGRLNGNVVFALCSYNAGINRIRSWEKSAPNNLPMDLFIETIPFEETREYGKKIASAGVIYGSLYYNLSPFDVVNHILSL